MDHRLQVLTYQFIEKALYAALLFVLYYSAINGYFQIMSFWPAAKLRALLEIVPDMQKSPVLA